MIKITYSSIDGVRKTRSFKTIDGARKFALDRVGPQDVEGGHYAVSDDGVGKVTWSGCSRRQLFGEDRAQIPAAAAKTVFLAIRKSDDCYDLYTGPVCPMNHFAKTFVAMDEVTGDNVAGWAIRSAHKGDDFDVMACPQNVYSTLKGALSAAREAFEGLLEYQRQEHLAEVQAENAWLRHAETGSVQDQYIEDMERAREAFLWG